MGAGQSAQVVLLPDAQPEVRFNDEVRGTAQVELKDSGELSLGDLVMLDDIKTITEFVLPNEDANAAHITLFFLNGRFSLHFDFTYNRARIAAYLERAEHFLEAAGEGLRRGHLEVFVEDAFHAAESLARAELLPLPDERFRSSKTHKTVISRLHWWASLGNIDSAAARLLSRLESLRRTATYGSGDLTLTVEEAHGLHVELLAMRDNVRERALARPGGPSRKQRAISMIAAEPLTAGQLVPLSANRIL